MSYEPQYLPGTLSAALSIVHLKIRTSCNPYPRARGSRLWLWRGIGMTLILRVVSVSESECECERVRPCVWVQV